jgi:1,2-diacylglycerol 3-alpha-glucosyltransferase
MKICMFTNTYLPQVGGVARSVHLFAEDLRAMGHRVLIVAPTYAEQNGDDAGTMDVLRMPAIQHFNDSDFSVQIPLPFMINDAIRTLARISSTAITPFYWAMRPCARLTDATCP